MKYMILLALLYSAPGTAMAQHAGDKPAPPIVIRATAIEYPAPTEPSIPRYHPAPSKINDLVHTKLDVRFDYKKCYLYGKEWITLRPHFYAVDSLQLDAKGMDIKKVALVRNGTYIAEPFRYDSMHLEIRLDRPYSRGEQYRVYIEYTARPREALGIKSNEQGLYFVNPEGADGDKPREIWTLGEPENASVWFPTIDKPNQKTTEEIAMTVEEKYVTLSNGRLASQKNNGDGTRTDIWKMDLPHSPYLFMMAVGDFRIVKDQWRGKELSYYLEPTYAPYARDIFADVPAAMDFFSAVTGVDFPWNKYAEIVVRDYVGGAMENTTAAVFGEPTQQTKRELADDYYNPGIEHELFHQWFGDYVTAESWSNITLNESFADFGEIIWLEHRYGKDAADEHLQNGLQGYLDNKEASVKSLVPFYYDHVKDPFGNAYQKGGRILNMLRNYLGAAAFYKGMHIYLTRYAFRNAEVSQWREALEEASGLDLHWFFDQWYFRPGHPLLDITYQWDAASGKESIFLQQTQDGPAFILPMAVDIYRGRTKERHAVWMTGKTDTISVSLPSAPDLVNVDADKVLVAQKTDHKGMKEYAFQYFHAPLYLDRLEAIEAASDNPADTGAQRVLIAALTDRFSGLRRKAIGVLNSNHEDIRNADPSLRKAALPALLVLAARDSNTLVRASAIQTLTPLKDTEYLPIFKEALRSHSYELQGAALNAIAECAPSLGMHYAKSLERDTRGLLTFTIVRLYASQGGDTEWPFVFKYYTQAGFQDQVHLTQKVSEMIGRLTAPEEARRGIEKMKQLGVTYKGSGAGPYIIKFLRLIKEKRAALNDTSCVQAVEEAIHEIEAAKPGLQ